MQTYLLWVSLIVEMSCIHNTFFLFSFKCLSSTTAFSYGGFFITRLEQETMGIQWSNVYSSMGDSLNFAWMCFMMLIDSGIYLIIGWYIRNVKPGKLSSVFSNIWTYILFSLFLLTENKN